MAKFCQDCGEKLSFFSSNALCKDCEAAWKVKLAKTEAELIARLDQAQAESTAKLTKIEKDIFETTEVTSEQLGLLKLQDKKLALQFYTRVYGKFVSDKELEEKELGVLQKIQTAFDLTNEDVEFDDRIRPYIYVNKIRQEGSLPSIDLQIAGSSPPVLKKGEVVHFADHAVLKEIKLVSLGYRGGSQGISFRITKRMSYRVGAHRGHIEKEDRFVETSRGALLITNQRLFLHPFPGHKPLSISLNKIISYQCFNNGIEIYKEGREKGYFFAIGKSGSVELFGLCLGHLLGQ